MTTEKRASAVVDLYESGSGGERATVEVTCADGTVVPITLPFRRTEAGDTAQLKYAREFGRILHRLSDATVVPYGERGWKVPYEGSEVIIGHNKCASYSEDGDRIGLEALRKALRDLRQNPSQITVAPFYEPEGREHTRQIG